VKAKNLLNKWDIDYSEVAIDTGDSGLKEFRDATQGARTVPQILIDGKLIGGFSDLTQLHMDGDLDELMKQDCET
jgi:glutaredoxin 3